MRKHEHKKLSDAVALNALRAHGASKKNRSYELSVCVLSCVSVEVLGCLKDWIVSQLTIPHLTQPACLDIGHTDLTLAGEVFCGGGQTHTTEKRAS